MMEVLIAVGYLVMAVFNFWLREKLIEARGESARLRVDLEHKTVFVGYLEDEARRLRARAVAIHAPPPYKRQDDETPPVNESGHRRRWRDNQESVEKALKWDDNAKGQQS